MKASEFDKRFDDGEDVTDHLHEWSDVRINQPRQRVNVDFPTWMVMAMDEEAIRLGVTRQSIIKTWIGERLGHMGVTGDKVSK